MTWRTIVITQRSKLDLKLNYLVVRAEETHRVFLGEIGTIIVESTAVSLTAALLSECMKRKIKIIFCDEKHNPSGELVPYYGVFDAAKRLKQQIAWNESAKHHVWQEIIKDKIAKQRDVLKRCVQYRGDAFDDYIDHVELGDNTNREGVAAKSYFGLLFGNSFQRDHEDAINAALDYGYAILLASFNREIVNQGCNTMLGIFHDNQCNQFNLSSDLMEPFRPIVDEIVFNMNFDEFDAEQKKEILSILEKQIKIGDKIYYLASAIQVYVRSVIDALTEENLSLLRFYTL